jgi:hypothetical protein
MSTKKESRRPQSGVENANDRRTTLIPALQIKIRSFQNVHTWMPLCLHTLATSTRGSH